MKFKSDYSNAERMELIEYYLKSNRRESDKGAVLTCMGLSCDNCLLAIKTGYPNPSEFSLDADCCAKAFPTDRILNSLAIYRLLHFSDKLLTPKHQAQKDALVNVWNKGDKQKVKRHFAGYADDGGVLVWENGKTSHTTEIKKRWDFGVLFNEEEDSDGFI